MNKKQIIETLKNMNDKFLNDSIIYIENDNKSKAIKEIEFIKDKLDILIYEIKRY